MDRYNGLSTRHIVVLISPFTFCRANAAFGSPVVVFRVPIVTFYVFNVFRRGSRSDNQSAWVDIEGWL